MGTEWVTILVGAAMVGAFMYFGLRYGAWYDIVVGPRPNGSMVPIPIISVSSFMKLDM